MRDLSDQLHDYHDALLASVEPVTAAEAMTTAAPPSPEARDRRARWQWRIASAAAAVIVVLIGSVAVLGGSGPMRWLTGDVADNLCGDAELLQESVELSPPVAARSTREPDVREQRRRPRRSRRPADAGGAPGFAIPSPSRFAPAGAWRAARSSICAREPSIEPSICRSFSTLMERP